MNNWLYALFMVVGGGSGLTSLVMAFRQNRKLRADTVHVLSTAAVTLVEPLESRLSAAEQRATVAEQRALAAEQRLNQVEQEANRLRYRLESWNRAIMEPGATVEWLRELVTRFPPL